MIAVPDQRGVGATPERIDLTGQALTIETLKKRRSGVYRTVPVPWCQRSAYRPQDCAIFENHLT